MIIEKKKFTKLQMKKEVQMGDTHEKREKNLVTLRTIRTIKYEKCETLIK